MVRCDQMVIWKKQEAGTGVKLSLYLEDNVRYDEENRTITENQLSFQLFTESGVEFLALDSSQLSGAHDQFYQRARDRRKQRKVRSDVEQTQYTTQGETDDSPELRLVQLQSGETQLRRLRIFPRSSTPYNTSTSRSDDTTPPEQITFLRGGVQVLIEGLDLPESSFDVGMIDLSADRAIIWTEASEDDQFHPELLQSGDAQLQIYLEGNIVLRQGSQTVRADQVFYDARSKRALIINADLRAFVPQLRSDIRIRAERIRQLSPTVLHAQNAWSTTSQYGYPGYRLQASDIYLEQRPVDPWLGGKPITIDPETGQPVREDSYWMTSLNNRFIVEDFPLLYTPIVSGPAEDPHIPIRNLSVGQDNIFGTQIEATWNLPQIFGFNVPRGIEWDLRTDYFSERGPRIGSDLTWIGWGLFGFDGQSRGSSRIEYLYDDGNDNLGRDRRDLNPGSRHRGQASIKHRQEFSNGIELQGEFGYLSDRNYLEQYYESQFDTQKDFETLLYLKQDIDNWSWSVLGRPELNDFEASTEWLPKADLYSLSEPLFGSPLTWSSHSSVGYGLINVGDPPSDPNDLYTPLPYLTSAEGLVAMSRHRVDAPFAIGPVNFVPYAMGEAAHWDEDLTATELDRLVGQVGVRAHTMLWKLYPYVQSDIFNLNGLMHKLDIDLEFSHTDSSQNFNGIPQYNEFDENAQERFRRRLVMNTYGMATLPMIPGFPNSPYDPRFYAIRSGAGNQVSSPWHELIDDQQVLRLSTRHRLQTKMGPPERRRIEDWMILETGMSYYPNSEDNFGEDFGLFYGNYEWRIGARNKLLASAIYDMFEGGQNIWNIGVLSQRSLRGSMYVGFRQVSAGPLNSQILTASYSYVMSPKWISTMGTAFDIGEGHNRGQSLTITRVGEYALLHFGASLDPSKGNASFGLSLEPKWGPFDSSSNQLSTLLKTR